MRLDGKTASYAVCGSTLASNVPLPELLPHGSEEPDFSFHLLSPSGQRGEEPSWYHRTLNADGSTWLSFAKDESGFLLRFNDLADFTLSEDGGRIECRPVPGTPDETIRHLLLDQVLPLALGHRGRLVLHAGAVADGNLGVAFLGEAGWGKSTLTACLCRLGWSLLSDDCLPLREGRGGFMAEASYPGIRLWPDALRSLFGAASGTRPVAHYSDKRRVDAGSMVLGMCSRRVPLRAVYLLDPRVQENRDGEVSITPIPSSERFLVYLKYLFRLDTTDRARLRAEFERLARLSEEVPVRRLTFRRDLEALPTVAAAVRSDVRSLQDAGAEPLRRDPTGRSEAESSLLQASFGGAPSAGTQPDGTAREGSRMPERITSPDQSSRNTGSRWVASGPSRRGQ